MLLVDRDEATDDRRDVERTIQALAVRVGGRENLLRYVSAGAEPALPQLAGSASEGGQTSEATSSRGFHILLRLDPDELRRIDEQSRASKFTRNRWAAALIRRALYGRAQFNAPDRNRLAAIAAELKSIDQMTLKSMKMIEHLEQSARACADRLQKMDALRDRLNEMAREIEAAVRGNDAYWEAVTRGDDAVAGDVEEQTEGSPKQALGPHGGNPGPD